MPVRVAADPLVSMRRGGTTRSRKLNALRGSIRILSYGRLRVWVDLTLVAGTSHWADWEVISSYARGAVFRIPVD
jgi:hypothetical protein